MAVDTISNFIAAVNAVSPASKNVYVCGTQDSNGEITISKNGAAFMKVFYSSNPNWGAATDANPKGAGVLVRGGQAGVDSSRYFDAQGFVNMLAAN